MTHLLAELGWPESAAIITAITTFAASLTTLAVQWLQRRARGHEDCAEELRKLLVVSSQENDRRWHVAMRKLRKLERQMEQRNDAKQS